MKKLYTRGLAMGMTMHVATQKICIMQTRNEDFWWCHAYTGVYE